MIEVEKLTLSAIGRFVEEQVIDFTKLGNLVQVDGFRTDTKGSSGSGKSTLFKSLDYLLGLNQIPTTVLQSRYTKESMSVTLVGKYDDQYLEITRGKGKLSVTIGDETTTGSELAEEKIDKILGMPRKLFRPLLHKRQKEGGFFLKLTAQQMHEFLTDCLGLSAVRKKIGIVETEAKKWEGYQAMNLLAENGHLSALAATDTALLALGSPPVKQVDQVTILGLKKQYDDAQELIAPIQAKHRLEMEGLELTKPQARSVSADLSVLSSLEAELTGMSRKTDEVASQNALDVKEERERAKRVLSSIQGKKVQLAGLSYHVHTAKTAKIDAARVAGEIKKIRESICPTCEQGWTTDAAKARESMLLASIKAHKDTIEVGDRAAKEIASLQQEISDLEPQAVEKSIPMPSEYTALRIGQDTLKTKISAERQQIRDWESAEHHANRVLLEQFTTQQRVLTEKHAAELQQLRGQADILRRSFEMAAQKLKFYEESKATYERSINALIAHKTKLTSDLAEATRLKEEAKLNLDMAIELKKALKEHTSSKFNEALEDIGATATEIIRAIPNMANATIQLEGEKETQEGKVKEEVNAVISMDGEPGIPIKSLSGGEDSSVDLAVDLAVIDLLENKSKKGINIFILDEPFTGLDTGSIEMTIEKLKSLNKRLIIVDHNPEIKQMVESKLLVVRDGLTSKVIQN